MPTSTVLKLMLVAIGLMVGGLALLGIPGALWLTAASPVARLLTSQHAPADAGWPMAIMHTLIWPWFLPAGYALAARLAPPGRKRLGMTLALTAAAAVLLGVAMEVRNGTVS